MGLDMFACTTPEKPLSAVDFTTTRWAELYYWRKHPDLHGWMEDLIPRQRRIREISTAFMSSLMKQTSTGLRRSIRAKKRLPHTERGSFLAPLDGSKSEMEADLAFIAKARQALADNLSTVYYGSSW